MSSDYLKNLTPEQRRENYRIGRDRLAARIAAEELTANTPAEEPEDVSMNEISGAIGEPEAAPAEIVDPSDPFSLWLLTLEDDTKALFSEEELRASFEESWKKAQQERKAKKKRELTESALASSRSHLGLLPAEQLERMAVAKQNARPVKLMITLPPAQANGQPADVGLRVDGRLLRDGEVHYCTYGEAASLREMMYRAGQHELTFKGENIRYRSWLLGRSLGMQGMTYEGN